MTTVAPIARPDPTPATRRGPPGRLLVILLLAGGLGWLGLSIARALTAPQVPPNDIVRRWVVYQYVRQGIDPYPLALHALSRTYGPPELLSRRRARIFVVPPYTAGDLARDAPGVYPAEAKRLLSAYGPPESVYPPSANALLAPLLGALPRAWMTPLWLAANLVLVLLAAWLMSDVLPTRLSPTGAAQLLAIGLLWWAPLHMTIITAQYSLLVVTCLLASRRLMEHRQVAAGLLFAVALVKPTIALPFVILFLVRRRYGALAIAGGVHAAGTLWLAWRFGVAPWTLLGQWHRTATYFANGSFTVQEYLEMVGFDAPRLVPVVEVAILLAALLWCLRHRSAADAVLFDFLCFVSVFWAYHLAYDFVILLPPVLRALGAAFAEERPARPLPARLFGPAGAYAVLGVSFAQFLYFGTRLDAMLRPVRWAARALLVAWQVRLALRMRGAPRR